MTACEVDGCDMEAKVRGFCMTHYMRWWRTGDPLRPRVTTSTKRLPKMRHP